MPRPAQAGSVSQAGSKRGSGACRLGLRPKRDELWRRRNRRGGACRNSRCQPAPHRSDAIQARLKTLDEPQFAHGPIPVPLAESGLYLDGAKLTPRRFNAVAISRKVEAVGGEAFPKVSGLADVGQ